MLKLELLIGVVAFCLWVFCIVEVVQTPNGAQRNLPKVGWLLLVLLFPFVGSIAWLVAGRPENERRGPGSNERDAPAYPEYDRPGRAAAVNPERDDVFLQQVRARAEEQRRRHDQQRRERERAQERPPAEEA